MAALGICESLLLALTEFKIISEADARDLLMNVAATHSEAAATSQSPEKHQAVIEIVQVLAGTTAFSPSGSTATRPLRVTPR
jgi:hypothetical protein